METVSWVRKGKNGCEVPEALICTEKCCYNILQSLLPPGIARIFSKTIIAAFF